MSHRLLVRIDQLAKAKLLGVV